MQRAAQQHSVCTSWRRRGDSGTVCVEQYSGFNPRTHTGCDKVPVYTDAQLFEFQSTHPHGVRLPTNNIVIQGFEFQSTHPHGVRHQHQVNPYTDKLVSIHAPTRGATPVESEPNNFETGFNPRTHTGCDTAKGISNTREQSFNPRTHTGCDVSRGVFDGSQIRFNPRTHTGCDVRMRPICLETEEFQSTHPHGVRPSSMSSSIKGLTVSIHAPTRGATIFCRFVLLKQNSFNPRTHTGCDA